MRTLKPELRELLIECKADAQREIAAIDALLGIESESSEPVENAQPFKVVRKSFESNNDEKRELYERIQQRIDAGEKVSAACKEEGISDPTYYAYKKKYGSGSNGKILSDKDLKKISEFA